MADLEAYRDKFGESGQRVLQNALNESRLRGQNYVGVEHIISALAKSEPELFDSTMRALSLDPGMVTQAVNSRLESARQHVGKGFRIAPETSDIFKRAMERARSRGCKSIAATDIFAVLSKPDGLFVEMLRNLGVAPKAVIEQVCTNVDARESRDEEYRTESGRAAAPGFHRPQDMAQAPSAVSVRHQVTAEEWQARVDLAAAYRLVALYGWDDLIFTHISARVTGADHHFLLNPYGMMFDEVTASRLVKVDLDGKKVLDSPYFINPAGFTIHSAVHAAREDALCVMHLHTDYGIAVSAQKNGLLPLSQQAMFALSSLAYHDYEGLALDGQEKPRLVADFGDKKFMILRNHGLLTVGRNAAEAFLGMFLLERACKIQILAQTGGGELSLIPNAILAKVASQMDVVTVGQGAALTWPGLLRKLDRIDPTYRD